MKKLVAYIMIIGCICFNSGCTSEEQQIQKITGRSLYEEKQKNENLLLIDVRSKEEFEQGHIRDALNIPVDQINDDNTKLYNKNVKVVVYCRSGSRSAKAASKLKELGFKQIYDMGGLDNWSYDLVSDTNNNIN